MQSDLLITCSELPDATLTVSSVKNIKTKPEVSVIARASLGELENVASGGFSSLAYNPKDLDVFCSSTQLIEDSDQGIQVWKVNPKEWSTGQKVDGSFKRAKMSEQTMITETYLKCQSGVACMSWPSDETLVAGCTDH